MINGAFRASERWYRTHDAVTGLPNRTGFRSHLHRTLVAAGHRDDVVTVLSVDLDRFKLVNEAYGHEVGDAVLAAAAERIRANVREQDVVARLASDEFVVCCAGLDAGEATSVADRIRAAFARPIQVAGERVHVSVSIGIAQNDPDGLDSPERILRDVGAAIARAKARGRSRCEVMELGYHHQARTRLDTENDLRDAIEAGELRVRYQPQVDLRTGEVYGVEALVRWHHPVRGLLLPSEFIPFAEESDLICELGDWVLRQVCTDLAHLPGQVSINLSARELDDERLVPRMVETLQRTGADPSRLWVEITESILMADAARNAEVLRRLRSLGLRIAMDDFGTGYSSLAYLKRFPVDALKIDRSFVDGVGAEAEDSAIVEVIIGLGRVLGMQVIAEGVETESQRDSLAALGCDVGQGFLFGPAVALDDLVRAAA
jgi:diguanylate cyclase (GGDEF)-like protein